MEQGTKRAQPLPRYLHGSGRANHQRNRVDCDQRRMWENKMAPETNQSLSQLVQSKVECAVWWLAAVTALFMCIANWLMFMSVDDPFGPRSFESSISALWRCQNGAISQFLLLPECFTVITILPWVRALSLTRTIREKTSSDGPSQSG